MHDPGDSSPCVATGNSFAREANPTQTHASSSIKGDTFKGAPKKKRERELEEEIACIRVCKGIQGTLLRTEHGMPLIVVKWMQRVL